MKPLNHLNGQISDELKNQLELIFKNTNIDEEKQLNLVALINKVYNSANTKREYYSYKK
jgi:hypothetical protein